MKDIPAFPQGNDRVVSARSVADSQGMTLRDYFAAKAMQGCIAGTPHNVDIDPAELATWCYIMADAMLKSRGE
jgi:hypothetical protein